MKTNLIPEDSSPKNKFFDTFSKSVEKRHTKILMLEKHPFSILRRNTLIFMRRYKMNKKLNTDTIIGRIIFSLIYLFIYCILINLSMIKAPKLDNGAKEYLYNKEVDAEVFLF